MADITINNVPTISYLAAGANLATAFTNLGSLRIAQLEAPGVEMARTGRSFVGGTSVVAGGLAAVTNLPTTAAAWVLYNSQPQASVTKCLVIKRLSAFFCSSTINAPASGFSIFAGVPPVILASPPTANAANTLTQATRGYGTPLGLIGSSAVTIPAGTCWHVFASATNITVANTTGPSCTADLSTTPFIVQPGFCLAAGILGSTVGTPLYGLSIAWDEVEMTLP